jgi:hypothetical protein
MANKLKVHFRISRGWELFFVALMIFSLMALFQETSIFLNDANGINWNPHLMGGVTFSGIATFWVTLITFFVAMFIVLARSTIVEGRNKTSNSLDYVVSFFSAVGIFMITIAVSSFFYYGNNTVPLLWNLNSILLIRLGFIFQAITVLWFGFTN